MRAPDTFHTDRLTLRPVTRADAADVFVYAGAAAPTRFMPFVRQRERAESLAFAVRCEEARASGAAFPWAIVERATGAFVGVIELRMNPPKADFGYILTEASWGRGFASEAAMAVVGWTIAQQDIHRVWATCHPDNAASAAVLKKAGLGYETTLANWEARPQLGEAAGPSCVYALTKPVA